MPELPEVETVRRILEPIVKDETIASIKVYREKNILTGADLFVSSLIGEKFLSVSRVGKYLLFHLTNDKVIVSHLRMEGKYFERETPKEEKHDILCYVFKSGKCLAYNDVRKFGVIELYKENEIMTKSPIHKLGKEPFVMEKEELLASLSKKKKTPIKTALLDQTIIAGLGNIYVDEVCFASGLNPLENSGNVTLSDCEKIIKESRRILKEAIDLGGSTIKSYHPKEGVNGEMQNELLVYNHPGVPCPHCGLPLKKITVGGRGTTYCPRCQKKKGYPFVVGVTGPIHSGKSTAAKYLENKGYTYISCDEEIHKLYEDKAVLKGVISLLGKDAVKGGKLNASYVRKKLSKDDKKNEELKAYLYPLLKKKIEKSLLDLGEDKKVVLEVPLLAGSGLEDLCSFTILVTADFSKQKERLLNEGKDAETLLKLNEKYPLEDNKKLASIVIINDYPEHELSEKLAKLSYLY